MPTLLDIYSPPKPKVAPTGIPGLDDEEPMSDVPSVAAYQKEQLANRAAQQAVAIQRQQAQQSRGGGIPYIPGMGKWGRYARIASHLSAAGESESAREGVAQVDAEIQRITSLMKAVDSAVIQLEAKRLAGLL